MKLIKKTLAIVLAALTIFALSVTAFAAEKTLDQIKEIVLADANVKASDVNTYFAHIDYDDFVKTWDVEFTVKTATGYIEYEYDVRASDGKILERGKEIKFGTAPVQGEATISKDQAFANACAAFGVNAKDAKMIKNKLEFDNGIKKYEIEFVIGNTEYECEVNATTGVAFDMEKETRFDNPFAKISAFFQRILDFFRNLFK